MDRAEEAVRIFSDGHACSQAVLLAFAPSLGIGRTDALRIAAGFAGGMQLGRTCGALTGAIMVLGLAMCDESCATSEGRSAVAAAVSTFAARFHERVGAVDCPDILGIDLRTPGAREAARDQELFTTRCLPAVRAAAEILEEMLPAERLAPSTGLG